MLNYVERYDSIKIVFSEGFGPVRVKVHPVRFYWGILGEVARNCLLENVCQMLVCLAEYKQIPYRETSGSVSDSRSNLQYPVAKIGLNGIDHPPLVS